MLGMTAIDAQATAIALTRSIGKEPNLIDKRAHQHQTHPTCRSQPRNFLLDGRRWTVRSAIVESPVIADDDIQTFGRDAEDDVHLQIGALLIAMLDGVDTGLGGRRLNICGPACIEAKAGQQPGEGVAHQFFRTKAAR